MILVRGSCGAGTLRGWDGSQATDIKPVAFRGQRLIASGPVRTIADAEVKGWEYQGKELNMINRYTLYAGHRDAQVDVLFDQPLDKETFCTGVQNIGYSATMYSDHEGLVASWGTDWPVGDTIKYKKKQSVWRLIFQRNTSERKLKTRKTSCTPSAPPKKRVSGTTPCLLHVRKHSDSLIQTHGSLTHKNGKNPLNNPAK